VLITSNGVYPFVDFQSVGLYDYNQDVPNAGPRGFDYVPTTGTAPDVHYDGTASFMPALEALKARSQRVQQFVGGTEVPLLLFLDWPTDNMNRYYALPTDERQDYVRTMLAEAYAYGMWFSLPLATTTDSDTATVLGMMDFFAQIRAFYEAHADIIHGAHDATAAATVTGSGLASHLATLDDGRAVLHIVNHNYASGFIPQSGVTASIPFDHAPATVTLVSPDFSADQPATFTYAAGAVSVDVGAVGSSVAVVVR
jgi:hypothetical protein